MNESRICISLAARSPEEMLGKIPLAEAACDAIELRLDCLTEAEALSLLAKLPETRCQYIITYRPQHEGGFREISLEERERFWNAAGPLIRQRSAWADIESDLDVELDGIISYHNLVGVPNDIDAIYDGLRKRAAERIVKIACTVEDPTDAIPLWRLLDKARPAGERVSVAAMGEAGKWTRILGRSYGSCITYASPEDGSSTAKGQISAHDLVSMFRAREIDRHTDLYAVLGSSVSASRSPAIQNAAFAQLTINAVFLPMMTSDIGAFLTRMVVPASREIELNWKGFSVTMPHKQSIIRWLDEVDATALAIGAVNTVTVSEGRLIGSNTDAAGFISPLRARFQTLEKHRVAIIGAGGAARACAYALRQAGAGVTILARDLEKAEKVAAEFGTDSGEFSDTLKLSDYDIVVNATPVGMNGSCDSIAALDGLRGVRCVYDLVTSRNDTPFIAAAKEAGAHTISGNEMLLAQGALQFKIWTGFDAPIDVMRRRLEA